MRQKPHQRHKVAVMILYELRCANGHNFEAWFLNSATYDSQAKVGEVECPSCSDTVIEKAPMAPRLSRVGVEKSAVADASAPAATAPKSPAENRAREVAKEILTAMKNVHDHVEENCDYVGDKFADEARAIHYGETEERGIYGEATSDEAKELEEEDIPVQRLPFGPRRDS
jgi:hypothetical protein